MVDFLKKILNISKIFFKNLISFILFLPKLLTGLIIIAGIVIFLRFSSLDRPIDVEDGSALYIPMEGLIVEEKTSNTDLGDIFFQETNTPQIDLHQLLNAIEGSFHEGLVGPCSTTSQGVLGNLLSLTLFIVTCPTATMPRNG